MRDFFTVDAGVSTALKLSASPRRVTYRVSPYITIGHNLTGGVVDLCGGSSEDRTVVLNPRFPCLHE